MKHLPYILIAFLSLNGISQVTSGSIEYAVVTQYIKTSDRTDMSDLDRFKEYKSNFIMEFDENYLRFFAPDKLNDYEYSLFNKKEEVILILMPGELGGSAEYYSTQLNEDLEKYQYDLGGNMPDTIVVDIPDSKEILGYHCERTIYEISNGTIITIWTTDEILNTQGLVPLEKSLHGTVLELAITENGKYVTQKATKIISGKPEKPFSMTPPADFHVNAPSIYVTKDSTYFSDRTFSFITYPTYKNGWESLAKALEKLPSIELQSFTSEYEMERSFVHVTIQLSATGEILSFNASSDANNEKQIKEVTKLLNNTGNFSTMKIEGQAVESVIELVF